MKYELDNSLKKIEKMKATPLNKIFLKGAKFYMRNVYKTLDKYEDITYEKFIIDNLFTIYVITPKNLENKKAPININYHGGAFVYKGWNNHFELAHDYAVKSNSRVIYVDYRLAFETKYHETLDDCKKVIHFVIENKDKYGFDLDNLIISGDSAGGYLALEINDYVTKNNIVKPKGLMLIYPVCDPAMTTKSMKDYIDTPVWNSKANKSMWNIYLKGNKEDSYLEKDINNIDNCYIEITEFDCLHDEGLILYSRLKDMNKNVYLNEIKKACHGYDTDINNEFVIREVEKRIEFLNNILK